MLAFCAKTWTISLNQSINLCPTLFTHFTVAIFQARELTREQIESELVFAGFVVISCPLKHDSKAVIKEIRESSHHVRLLTLHMRLICSKLIKSPLKLLPCPKLICKILKMCSENQNLVEN